MNGHHYVDGKWVDGNPTVMRVWDHAIWMGAAIFDGARAFEGRDTRSRTALPACIALGGSAGPQIAAVGGGDRGASARGHRQISQGHAALPAAIHVVRGRLRWSPVPEATTLIDLGGRMRRCPTRPARSVSFSKWRRPSPETAPTNAKAVEPLRPGRTRRRARRGRAASTRRSCWTRMGNVAEFSAANLWIAKDGAAHTPVPNGTFLNGITRQRTIQLLRKAGVEVYERTLTPKDILEADEIFSSRQLRQGDADHPDRGPRRCSPARSTAGRGSSIGSSRTGGEGSAAYPLRRVVGATGGRPCRHGCSVERGDLGKIASRSA